MILRVLQRLARLAGHNLVPLRAEPRAAPDMDPDFAPLLERVKPFTMTSAERLYALRDAVRFAAASGIEGGFAECGVWRGGSAMLAAIVWREMGETARPFHLYDTFEGMTEPGAADVSIFNETARDTWRKLQAPGEEGWCVAGLDEVRRNMESTGYPAERFHYVKGKVEETIPAAAPERIAILRLDTDWRESTLHELIHLYPRLSPGGVLIIDDYGHWRGAREAVEEYFAARPPRPLLARIDYSARMAVKPPENPA